MSEASIKVLNAGVLADTDYVMVPRALLIEVLVDASDNLDAHHKYSPTSMRAVTDPIFESERDRIEKLESFIKVVK